MTYEFISQKKKKRRTSTKRLSLLPRFGIYLDVFGREYTFKKVPFIETLYNLITSRGLTISNLKKIKDKQFSEIDFSKVDDIKTVNTTAKAVARKKLG